jgi:phospholipid/cholesterol/gamma-HCH transport system ATP-binding protein
MTQALKANPDQPVAAFTNVSLSLGDRLILDDFSLTLPPGSKTALLGESSCGKSVALKTLVGLFAPQAGQVFLFGQDLAKASQKNLATLRRGIGMQFQAGALFDSVSVRLNLALASSESSRGDAQGRAASDKEILGLLDQVGLREAAERQPASLSGGMRKRAALARALIANPKLAIFDEPTAGLDPQTSSRIINLLNSLAEASEAAMLLATADPDVARRFTENIALMKNGRVYAQGSLTDLRALGDPYVDRFLSRLPEA